MIYVAKVFSIILGLMVISKTLLDFKKKQESLIMFIFWTVTWAIIIYLGLFPAEIDKTINRLGMNKTGTGTFFGMSLVFLFFVIYRVYHKANRLELKLKDMTMKLGLKDVKE
ncbi:MAG: DUF2304 domain-containing protein [Patescibacteria group bacterium]|jgi:hypothetical protein